MKRLRRSAAVIAVALVVAGACRDDSPPQKAAPPPPAEPKSAPPIPAELLPLDALVALGRAPAALPGPCADTGVSLATLARTIADHRQRLGRDPEHRRAPVILRELSAAIAETTAKLPAPAGGEELLRTHRELVAAWRDLERALTELASALDAGDHASARRLEPRIANGIDNLGVTLERMRALCAAP